jgi:hypothetical protein
MSIRADDYEETRARIVARYGRDSRELSALVADRVHSFEFEHVFTLDADGTITEPAGVWAPECYNDPDGDIDLAGAHEWSAMVGLTGQDSYHGAVMHPSEYVGRGVATAMLELAEGGPVTFALVIVTDLDADRDAGEDDACGWAIAYTRVVAS